MRSWPAASDRSQEMLCFYNERPVEEFPGSFKAVNLSLAPSCKKGIENQTHSGIWTTQFGRRAMIGAIIDSKSRGLSGSDVWKTMFWTPAIRPVTADTSSLSPSAASASISTVKASSGFNRVLLSSTFVPEIVVWIGRLGVFATTGAAIISFAPSTAIVIGSSISVVTIGCAPELRYADLKEYQDQRFRHFFYKIGVTR
jgi:hypothetical protein